MTWKRLIVEALAIASVTAVAVSHVASIVNVGATTEHKVRSQSNRFEDHWQVFYNYLRKKAYDDRMIFAIGTWIVHQVTFITLNIFLYFVYYFNLFTKYKIQDAKYPEWPLVKKALMKLSFEQFVVNPILLYIISPTFVNNGLNVSGPLPSWTNIILHVIGCFIVNETLFYWSHRILHHRRIYKYIHKEHHSFKVPIGIASEYAHPVEELIANITPTFAGSLLLGSHIVVLWIWLAIRIWETVDTHSGYRFPYSPWGLVDGAGRHDFHHSHNVGNYGGSMIFWDWLCGSDKAYQDHIKREKKM